MCIDIFHSMDRSLKESWKLNLCYMKRYSLFENFVASSSFYLFKARINKPSNIANVNVTFQSSLDKIYKSLHVIINNLEFI